MDPLDFLEPKQLLLFFHCSKTELSLMDNPHAFLSQLRDHNLIPDDRYQRVSRMRNKENIKKALYEILDWLERERSEHIQLFWGCVFRDSIISIYPTLRRLRTSLMDGSFEFNIRLPEKLEADNRKKKDLSEEEESSPRKKMTLRSRSVCDDEETEPGPSSHVHTPASPMRKGEQNDFWNWPLYKSQLPVTCGNQEGSLTRERLAKGEKCILSQKQWFTPSEFEEFGGKRSSRNWKTSIRCMGIPLGKLIKEGHLKTASYQRKARRFLFSSVITVHEGEENIDDEDEDGEDQEEEVSSCNENDSTDENGGIEESAERNKKVFKVTCGDVTGTLHKKRFASGTCGKSIRTECDWLTPVEFLKASSNDSESTWKKNIKVDGRPLTVLIESKVLRIHSLLCSCRLCSPTDQDLEDQQNDDECFVCKNEDESNLVECDLCPRSFHQECHLPHIDDATLRDEGKWLCTFCVFKRAQKWHYCDERKMEEAVTRHISQHKLDCQYLLLFLHSADEEQTFALDPTLYLKNYSAIIKTPMWFGKVTDKLQMKQYQTVGEFMSDIQLIFTNCATYNKGNAEFLAKGQQMKELFHEEFKKVFNICE
ncbi:nuclear body protein SP140-like isoform X2 [Echeneis naucrates]|uniref:nuclear body protein SP140-like isoform X2 n=1 Tax=Echeneis naucrates TaxID=173247 RepID=UPI001113C761|nr:nuclear body protein SP140-like isoform X2 [Echeneis naucrates]